MNNFVQILGTAAQEPVFSHSIYGVELYMFEILAERLSGRIDRIPCLIAKRLLPLVNSGQTALYCGQLRSYNRIVEGANRLELKFFVREVRQDEVEQSFNHVVLTGYICKQPVYRRTPFGREITDMLFAVNRAYHKSDYIPIITWGRIAREARDFQIGDKLEIIGRLQSREYEKKLPEGERIRRMTYEVSVGTLELVPKDDGIVRTI